MVSPSAFVKFFRSKLIIFVFLIQITIINNIGFILLCFLKFVFKNYFLFFNLKKIFNNKFEKT